MINKFDYIKAESLKSAVGYLSSDKDVRIHAGGTDLLGCLRDNVFGASKLVSLHDLDLQGISNSSGGSMTIGAMTSVADIAASESVAARYPALAAAAKVVSSPQLRNQGTIGGNICQRPRCWYYRGEFDCIRKGGDTCYATAGENSYHAILGGDDCYIVHPSDLAPALIAHDTQVEIFGPKGPNTMPLEKFFLLPKDDAERENILKPDEIVTKIILPKPVPTLGTYNKVRTRESWDFAIVSAAVVVAMDGDKVKEARIVLGGVAPRPWRAAAAEKLLIGNSIREATARKVADAALEGAKPLSKNRYKIAMAKGAIIEALLNL
jgi:xanthine dehydrogenase YagS FAD-binding subunit